MAPQNEDIAYVQLDNADEIDRLLLRASREFGPENTATVLRGFMRGALKPHIPYIQAKTPVDTGALRDSVRVATRTLSRGATVGALIGWARRKGSPVRTAQFLAAEYGNEHQRAFGPTIIPSFNALRGKITTYIQRNIGPVITSRIRQLARRRDRQGRSFRVR